MEYEKEDEKEDEESKIELTEQQMLDLFDNNLKIGSEIIDNINTIYKNCNVLCNKGEKYDTTKFTEVYDTIYRGLSTPSEIRKELSKNLDEINTKLKIILASIKPNGVLLDKKLSIKNGTFRYYNCRGELDLHEVLKTLSDNQEELVQKITDVNKLEKIKYVFLKGKETSELDKSKTIIIPIEKEVVIYKGRYESNNVNINGRILIDCVNEIKISPDGEVSFSYEEGNRSLGNTSLDRYIYRLMIMKYKDKIQEGITKLKENLNEIKNKQEKILEEINSKYSKELIFAQINKMRFYSNDTSVMDYDKVEYDDGEEYDDGNE